MAVLFLTSSPTGPLDGSRVVHGLDRMNGFVDRLSRFWKAKARVLMISASPDAYDANDEMIVFFRHAFEISGLTCGTFDLWDHRSKAEDYESLGTYDVIILGGGHVPTQQAYFLEIGLREKIADFPGIIIGISAGTMNCADIVYAQPEESGEAVDPAYKRFITGLGLTKTMLLPHYQMVKDYYLDGKRLYEDITYGDSYGHKFYVLKDGSYLFAQEGKERIFGEAYCIADGKIHKLSDINQEICI